MAAVKPAQIVNVVVAHDQDKQTISKSLARTLPSSIRTIAMLTFIQILCQPSRDPRLLFVMKYAIIVILTVSQSHHRDIDRLLVGITSRLPLGSSFHPLRNRGLTALHERTLNKFLFVGMQRCIPTK